MRTCSISLLNNDSSIGKTRWPEGKELFDGPISLFCNLHLAAAQVMQMSGATDIVLKWKEEADYEASPHPLRTIL
ncbi:hypothetical protein JVU11DRAFT_2948 [Chiua virens]|nr:hypothetical protein JVU11DRAFT_2948 [Chiua virens]